MSIPSQPLSLAQWRRMVAEMYAQVRCAPDDRRRQACQRFRAERDELFRYHPQTPLSLEQRAQFRALSYYPYAPEWRISGRFTPEARGQRSEVELGADGLLRYTAIGRVQFTVLGQACSLSVFWIEGYGGGLFLPFRDITSEAETYGGGRYLIDSIKGADLGGSADSLILDFNYAYNPSCAYNSQWVCPLSPPENTLAIAVAAGEKRFHLPEIGAE